MASPPTRRLSVHLSGRESPLVFTQNSDSELWFQQWQTVSARDLIDTPVVWIDADKSVEEACDLLLTAHTPCVAIKDKSESIVGLFDFADVNAFLTLAATRHTFLPDEIEEISRVEQIVSAAKTGRVSVLLVSNLSEKNPLATLPYDATIIDLLRVFSGGTHRVLLQSGLSSIEPYLGFVSDRGLLSWFSSHAESDAALLRFLENPLRVLPLPTINIRSSVVSATSDETVLDAMRLMSSQGVSSVAVLDDASGMLLSTVSVTDVGNIVMPSQSNQILTAPLHQFIIQIKEPDGSTDGVDRYPVYSVLPTSSLLYTIQKLLATNAHRVFVTSDPLVPPTTPSAVKGNLCGIVSVLDVLSQFARLANLPDVNPSSLRHRRRASSTSSHGSRSSSRGEARVRMSGPMAGELNNRSSVPSIERNKSGEWLT